MGVSEGSALSGSLVPPKVERVMRAATPTLLGRYRVLVNDGTSVSPAVLHRVTARGTLVLAGEPFDPARAVEWLRSSVIPASEALVATRSLAGVAAASQAGLDSMFLLGAPNGMRDVAFSHGARRPTYVAMDDRALQLPAWTADSTSEPAAEITLRGRIKLHRSLRPPHEMVEDAVRVTWQTRVHRYIMVSAREEIWRPVEVALREKWETYAALEFGV